MLWRTFGDCLRQGSHGMMRATKASLVDEMNIASVRGRIEAKPGDSKLFVLGGATPLSDVLCSCIERALARGEHTLDVSIIGRALIAGSLQPGGHPDSLCSCGVLQGIGRSILTKLNLRLSYEGLRRLVFLWLWKVDSGPREGWKG